MFYKSFIAFTGSILDAEYAGIKPAVPPVASAITSPRTTFHTDKSKGIAEFSPKNNDIIRTIKIPIPPPARERTADSDKNWIRII